MPDIEQQIPTLLLNADKRFEDDFNRLYLHA